jgi:hypothetical protein
VVLQKKKKNVTEEVLLIKAKSRLQHIKFTKKLEGGVLYPSPRLMLQFFFQTTPF